MRQNEIIANLEGLRFDLENGKIVFCHDDNLKFYAVVVAEALYTLVDMDKWNGEKMNRDEIMNALESIVETLYEFDAYDAQYYEQVIGEVMDRIEESDEWAIYQECTFKSSPVF